MVFSRLRMPATERSTPATAQQSPRSFSMDQRNSDAATLLERFACSGGCLAAAAPGGADPVAWVGSSSMSRSWLA